MNKFLYFVQPKENKPFDDLTEAYLPKSCCYGNIYTIPSPQSNLIYLALVFEEEHETNSRFYHAVIIRHLRDDKLKQLSNLYNNCDSYCNTGSHNTGNKNAKNYNTGDSNTGSCNTNNSNSGEYNCGHHNSGNFNKGNYNSGGENYGDFNSGFHNFGCRNSGTFNIGARNSGAFNLCNDALGSFNTESIVYMFNKPTNLTFEDAEELNGISIMNTIVNTTDPKNGRVFSQMLWDWLADSQKQEVYNLPNFDKAIFEEITGLKI